MKLLSLIAIVTVLVPSIASASSRFVDVSFTPKQVQDLCTYETSMPFSSFPDVEVFSAGDKENVFHKVSASVRTSVEVISPSSYVLTLFAAPGMLPEHANCPALNLKLLVR